MTTTKTNPGNFFEDFRYGQIIRHATPRTITEGDAGPLHEPLRPALRRAVLRRRSRAPSAIRRHPSTTSSCSTSSSARRCRTSRLNAIANLGYAEGRFLRPAYPGDTLSTVSEVIGLKENSNRETGTVYVRSTGSQPARRGRPRVRALGHGAKARQGGARPRSGRAQASGPRRSRGHRRSRAEARCRRLRLPRSRARRTAGATTRRASASTTWTA